MEKEINKKEKCYKIATLKGPQGQGLIATRAIKTGEIILEEDAVVSMMNMKLAIEGSLKLVDHQTTYDAITGTNTSLFVLLTLRVCEDEKLLKKIKALNLCSSVQSKQKLQGSERLITDDQKYIYKVVRTNCYAQGNIFNIANNLPICIGLFPTFSRINHRCVNFNTSITMNGSKIRVVAIKNLKPNEHITVTYRSECRGTPLSTLKHTQHNGFDCCCKDCSNEKFRDPFIFGESGKTYIESVYALIVQKNYKGVSSAGTAKIILMQSTKTKFVYAMTLFDLLFTMVGFENCKGPCLKIAQQVLLWYRSKEISLRSMGDDKFVLFCMVLLTIYDPPLCDNETIFELLNSSPHLSIYSEDILYAHAALNPLTVSWLKKMMSELESYL